MPKKKVDKYIIMCKIIEFAEKSEEITVYNMVKNLRKIGVDIEEETVRRILKELERFGILKFKETGISKTKKEKKVYKLVIPPNMAKSMVEILLRSKNFFREVTAKVFSSLIVLAKEGSYFLVGFDGEREFKRIFFDSALPSLIEACKPDFVVVFSLEGERGFTAVIMSSFGTFTITEKEEHVIDEVKNEGDIGVLLKNLNIF